MASLEIRDLTKVYSGGVTAVSGASVHIADGEFIVLVGPSGCGKSTILRMVAGLESITGGDVLIDGNRVNDLEPGDRDIAMVFQSYALYPHMSVYDNMAYGLKNQGMKRDEIQRRIDVAAEILQLGEFLKRKPRQLSGGQRQRVAMGRAIVREPKAFLLDEPLSNLDAKLRAHMRNELKSLHQRLKATFIHVTHDQVEAMSLADRIVVMNGGCIEQVGTPREVYDRPASRFVAEFIGSPPMNFLRGAAVGRHAAWIGVRPEALAIATAADGASGQITIEGNVVGLEDLGADRFVHVRANGAATEADVVVRINGADVPAPGTNIALVAPEASLHQFDAEGRSLGNSAGL